MPPVMDRGSYHPITLVQRECERIFKSMGFTVEDYSEIVTDYECFESLNIPKHHPARDMQDTYYLTNGQLLRARLLPLKTLFIRSTEMRLLMTVYLLRLFSRQML